MRKFGVVLVSIFILIASANAQKRVLDKIVGQVGGAIILQSDIETSYAQYLSQGGQPNQAIKCQIAQNLISQKLLTQQAVIDSIEVKENEVDEEVDRRMRQSIQRAGGEDKLEQALHISILQFKDQIRPDVKEMLIADRMRSKITEKLNTTPQDIKKYFETFPKDSLPMISKEVQVGEIVFNPKLTKEEKSYARGKAEELLKRFKAGENFEVLARLYSQDPGSAAEGGDLGWGDRTGYVKEFTANAFKLKAGDVSPVFESDFGFHFVQVLERRGEQIHSRHILIVPKITPESLVKAKERADSIYNVIIKQKSVTSEIFSNAAGFYSDDKESKYNGGMLMNPENVQVRTTLIPTERLDPQTALVIDTMKVGGLSKPVLIDAAGKQSYKIFFLKSVTDAHKANMDQDFPKLKVAANEDKINRTVSEWFEKKRKQTFIKINAEYQSCPVIKDWATPSTNQAKL